MSWVVSGPLSVNLTEDQLHNPDFNHVQFEAVKNEAGLNRFVMTPTKWITQMNAIGIVSKAGRYGGTYAHSDIAMSSRVRIFIDMDRKPGDGL